MDCDTYFKQVSNGLGFSAGLVYPAYTRLHSYWTTEILSVLKNKKN